jgi:hypothetical protein
MTAIQFSEIRKRVGLPASMTIASASQQLTSAFIVGALCYDEKNNTFFIHQLGMGMACVSISADAEVTAFIQSGTLLITVTLK